MTDLGDQTVAAGPANRAARVPDRPALEGLEAKWTAAWEAAGTYRFDPSRPRRAVFAIDTPPLTVSGSLHVGHVFSYTHTDTVARYRRMRGRTVFYPVGWDDNGLPTERRVENHYGVRCDPSLPYDPGFTPPERPTQPKLAISRRNFIELCARLTAADERAFAALWRRLGLSVDWTRTYTTIGAPARRASQRAFLRLLARGEAYQAEAPVLWDVTYRTAVAQAELEDRELPGAVYRLRFGDLEVDTTRPELLPACVALVAHPDDRRFAGRIGQTVPTPLFGVEVPLLAHQLAEQAKGTGLAMVCTFGDVTDIVWWRELRLPVRSVVTRDGRIAAVPPPGVPANAAWAELAGRTVASARAHIARLLRAAGDLVGEPRPTTHPVKFYEHGDQPLEIVTSRQWFIRLLAHRERLLARGRQLAWVPPFMRARYEHWVDGLTGDWLVSRQRFLGVPIPLWYAVGEDGGIDYDHPIAPGEHRLPVDPAVEAPDGYDPSQRDRPGGFTGDPDVLDTWATSSLTPHITGGWEDDPDLFARVFPMDLHPQGQEIIRTWLFYSVLRAELEQHTLPWSTAAISGWVVDPDRKKMSKSKGNVVTPADLLARYGSDAVRYWAASARPGSDTAFDDAQMKVGRRLAIKLLNASRFVLARPGPAGGDLAAGDLAAGDLPSAGRGITEPLDRAMLARLDVLVADATAAFDGYDYARALARTEAFFWAFCDDYLELVKARAYGSLGEGGAASANRALTAALSVLLRLFAPFLPFATEEVWSWWQDGSIHRAAWPSRLDPADFGDPLVLDVAGQVLGQVRKAKSTARRSMRAPVRRVTVAAPPGHLAALRSAEADLRGAGTIAEVAYAEAEAETLSVAVELAPGE